MALSEKQRQNIPQHIAIIMDGNGRWAKQRGLPRTAGHKAGAETFRRIAEHCHTLGVKYLTVYAFSTENWKRSAEEVSGIMLLLKNYLQEALRDMEKNHIHFNFMGDLSRLSPELQKLCRETQAKSSGYHDVQVNLCINYGGRDEIVHAVNMALAEGKSTLSEADIERHLYTAASPDPDLIVRTAGEMRLSNFLLWQAAYSEFYYTDVLWPDLTHEDIDKACLAFLKRKRNFGGIKETNG